MGGGGGRGRLLGSPETDSGQVVTGLVPCWSRTDVCGGLRWGCPDMSGDVGHCRISGDRGRAAAGSG